MSCKLGKNKSKGNEQIAFVFSSNSTKMKLAKSESNVTANILKSCKAYFAITFRNFACMKVIILQTHNESGSSSCIIYKDQIQSKEETKKLL